MPLLFTRSSVKNIRPHYSFYYFARRDTTTRNLVAAGSLAIDFNTSIAAAFEQPTLMAELLTPYGKPLSGCTDGSAVIKKCPVGWGKPTVMAYTLAISIDSHPPVRCLLCLPAD